MSCPKCNKSSVKKYIAENGMCGKCLSKHKKERQAEKKCPKCGKLSIKKYLAENGMCGRCISKIKRTNSTSIMDLASKKMDIMDDSSKKMDIMDDSSKKMDIMDGITKISPNAFEKIDIVEVIETSSEGEGSQEPGNIENEKTKEVRKGHSFQNNLINGVRKGPSLSSKKTKKIKISAALRSTVWQIQFPEKLNGNCYCCKRNISYDYFECGHILPESKGGETVVNNLRPICGACNKSMGTMHMDDFIKTISSIETKNNLEDRIDMLEKIITKLTMRLDYLESECLKNRTPQNISSSDEDE